MLNANYLRRWARRCHSLAQITTDPEARYQLRDWAMEFDRDADELERPLKTGKPASPPV
jgi:hypothetical protein